MAYALVRWISALLAQLVEHSAVISHICDFSHRKVIGSNPIWSDLFCSPHHLNHHHWDEVEFVVCIFFYQISSWGDDDRAHVPQAGEDQSNTFLRCFKRLLAKRSISFPFYFQVQMRPGLGHRWILNQEISGATRIVPLGIPHCFRSPNIRIQDPLHSKLLNRINTHIWWWKLCVSSNRDRNRILFDR